MEGTINIIFTYLKPYFTFSEMLELTSFKEMSMRRIMAEVNNKGNSLESIGFFKLPGVREYLIEPYAFQKHLESLMILQPRYDYEFSHQDEIKKGLKVVANHQQHQQKGNY